MSQFDEPLDDLPDFSRVKGSVKQERVVVQPSFKGSVLKAFNKSGQKLNAGRGGARRGGHPSRGRKPAVVASSSPSSRRVIVKARYVQNGTSGAGLKAGRLHLKYVERDGVDQDGGKGQLFTAQGREPDGDSFLARAENDPHQFRFIVAPEDAAEIDLERYTKDLMRQVETDLGRKLDWVAVNHYNTENPHTHVVVRGRDQAGDELRIDRQYLSHGLRDRARELATRELGPRLAHEIQHGLRNEVTALRWTSLDTQIDKVSHEKLADGRYVAEVNLESPGRVVHANLDRHVVGRLQHLQSMGLAEETGPRQFTLRRDYKQALRDFGEQNDIIKMMHRRAGAGEPLQIRMFDPQQGNLVIQGRLREKGLADEMNDRYYAWVDTPDGNAYCGRGRNDTLSIGPMVLTS